MGNLPYQLVQDFSHQQYVSFWGRVDLWSWTNLAWEEAREHMFSHLFVLVIITWADDIHGTCDVSIRVLLIMCVLVITLWISSQCMCVLRCVERRLFKQISFVVSSAWIRCVCFATFVAWDVYTPEDYITWNTTMKVLKIIFLSKWMICRFHINLPGCISVFFSSWVWWCQRSWYLQHKNDQLSKVAPMIGWARRCHTMPQPDGAWERSISEYQNEWIHRMVGLWIVIWRMSTVHHTDASFGGMFHIYHS